MVEGSSWPAIGIGSADGSNFQWDEGMTDSEKKLLTALVAMVQQHLPNDDDEVDTLAASAGQLAIEALADFGLMEIVDTRFGRWTEAGRVFLEEIGYVRPEPAAYPGSIRLVGRSEPEK
jgi:hypothetical protein